MVVNMEEKIINIINKKMELISQQISNESVKNERFLIQITNLEQEIQKVVSNVKELSNFDLNKITTYFDVDVETIKKLKFYGRLLDKIGNIDEHQKQYIVQLFNSYSFMLNQKIDEIKRKNSSENQEYNNLKQLKEKIKQLSNGGCLTSGDIDLLEKILKDNFEIKEVMDIIIEISVKSLKNMQLNDETIEQQHLQEDIGFVEESNLNEEKVIELLKRYKYDFNLFSSSSKQKILKYGNLDNIESILNLLSKYNIFVNDYVGKSPRLAEILCFSNTDIISVILNDLIDDMKANNKFSDEQLNNVFLKCLNISNIFVKKKLFRKDNRDGNSSEYKTVVSGAYNNYIQNRELLIKLGVKDISKAIGRCSSFFVTPVSTNLKKKEAFDFYQIPVDIYINTLSSFEAPTPMRTMDRFIELGYFNYLTNNFSNMKKSYYSPIFYKLKRAQQLGLTHEDIWSSKSELRGVISIDKTEFLEIKGNNGALVVGEYRFEKDLPIFGIYDSIIYGEETAASLKLVWNNFYIKEIEKYRDPNNENIYNFDGVIISRYKVLRLYETLMKNKLGGTESAIIYSICKYSILTEEEYRVVEKCIGETFKQTRKVGKI